MGTWWIREKQAFFNFTLCNLLFPLVSFHLLDHPCTRFIGLFLHSYWNHLDHTLLLSCIYHKLTCQIINTVNFRFYDHLKLRPFIHEKHYQYFESLCYSFLHFLQPVNIWLETTFGTVQKWSLRPLLDSLKVGLIIGILLYTVPCILIRSAALLCNFCKTTVKFCY